MTTITTKYSIGDVVWRAGLSTESRQHPCPDCLGTRRWKAISPAGAEHEFECPRCSARYRSDQGLSLSYSVYCGDVRSLTIGSVQVDTNSDSEPVRYMCLETGVGSGSVYREADLHPSREEASAAAAAKAEAANRDTEWVVKQYDATLRLSDYQLCDAQVESARTAMYHAQARYSLLREDIQNATSLSDLQGDLERAND